MTVPGSQPESDDIQLEFRAVSDDAERARAGRGYRRLARRKRRLWPLFFTILVILVLLWSWAWVAYVVELALSQFFSGDALWLAKIAISLVLMTAIFLSLGALFRRAERRKESRQFHGIVRFHRDGDVSFVDENIQVRRHAQSIIFDKEFVYAVIEGGDRFVYVPRRVINPEQFEKLMNSGNDGFRDE